MPEESLNVHPPSGEPETIPGYAKNKIKEAKKSEPLAHARAYVAFR
jgi:hypothetical protein